MKVLILLAMTAVAYGQHWAGQAAPVQDTPEVAAAKAAHYAALARERSSQQPQWGQPNQWNQNNQWNAPPPQWNQQPQYNEPIKKWYGPLALPPGYDNNGAPLPVRDTPEVAAEKAKHFSLTGGYGAPAPAWNGGWNGAPAAPQWNQGGYNQGHGRWRRSAVIATAPLAYSTLAVHAPIVAAAPLAHIAATPLIATHW
uniref:Uncharacterized protein n=1 Tax=Pristhesancus plagipennis TaxID=1955184 RepID=A0A2K8JMY0_PRIPG|nr:secreted hypothetical protein [Pristhesancus plagipennis]